MFIRYTEILRGATVLRGATDRHILDKTNYAKRRGMSGGECADMSNRPVFFGVPVVLGGCGEGGRLVLAAKGYWRGGVSALPFLSWRHLLFFFGSLHPTFSR